MEVIQRLEGVKREILDRVDLATVVAEHVTLKRAGRRLVGLCPFHTEKTPSFTVNPDLGVFKCFGCGKGGDVFTFVQLRESVGFMEALRLLADRAGVTVKLGNPEGTEGVGRAELFRLNAWAAEFFQSRLQNGPAGEKARAYLADRGFTTETVERFGVGLSVEGSPSLMQAAGKAGFAPSTLVQADLLRTGDDGRHYETFRDRLMFPIRDASRRVIGFGGRTTVDDKAKYLNTRQTALFEKGRGLFGVDLARDAMSSRGRAVVVEGYTDCMACHQAGFTETVATLGTALTETQVDLLRRFADEIILLFDSDAAGEEAANRAIRMALPRNARCRMARVPSGKDPADFLRTEEVSAFSDVLNGAVDALEFVWHRTTERFNHTSSNAARREAVLSFLGTVGDAANAAAVDAIQRGLLVNQVAHLLRLEHAEVQGLLSGATKLRRPEAAARGTAAVRSKPADAEQAAWVRVWEVLLNEPALIGLEGPLPDVATIEDARLQRVAQIASGLAALTGEFELKEVLCACTEPDDAAFAVELASRGGDRTRYRDKLRNALDQIRKVAGSVEKERGKEKFRQAEHAVDSERAVLMEGARIFAPDGHRHFASRRSVRAVRGGSAADVKDTKSTT